MPRIKLLKLCIAAFTLCFLPLTSQAESVGVFKESQICKAAISTIMGRDPTSMKIKQSQNSAVIVSYKRDDGNNYSYKCKTEGKNIIWGNQSGRWRTNKFDSKVSFTVQGNNIEIKDQFNDGSSSKKSFTYEQLL